MKQECIDSHLILLRGNSGSGKTTVAKMLQRKLGRGTLYIPQDVIRRELLWVKDEPDNKAIPLLENLLDMFPERIIKKEQSAEEIVEMIWKDIDY